MKHTITILLLLFTVSTYAQNEGTLRTIKVSGVDTAAMLLPYKQNYPRQAISLVFTTTGTSGASTMSYNSATGVLTVNIPQYSSVQKFTPTAIPFAGGDSILTEASTALAYVAPNVLVGANNPSVASGFQINGNRASIYADINGMLLQGGVSTTYDATKHFRFRNGSVSAPYLEMYTVGLIAPFVHHSDFTTHVSISETLTVGATSPAASAIVDITSTTTGVLLPRMTKTERDAISSPAQGLLVFVTDNGGYLSWYNSGWLKVSSAAD